MKQKPQSKNAPLLDKEMKAIIFIVCLATSALLFSLFLWLIKDPSGYDIKYIRTMIFAGLGVSSLFFVFSCKSLRRPIWKINPFSNKYLIVSVLVGLGLMASAIYIPFLQGLLKTVPLTHWYELLIIASIAIFNVAVIEIIKWIFIKLKKK